MIYKIDPREVEDLLNWFIKQGFTRQVAGPLDRPYVIVLFYVWGTHIDVAHVRSLERVDVARISTVNGGDIYNPEQVVWHYFSDAVSALTALQRLPNPYQTDVPTESYKPPRALTERQLATVRPGEPTEALRVNATEREKLTIRIPERH